MKIKNKKKDKRFGFHKNPNTDGLDSSKGYFIDNIVWTSKTKNRVKVDLSTKYFFKMCEMVYLFNKVQYNENFN
jgi:hypothetical protein